MASLDRTSEIEPTGEDPSATVRKAMPSMAPATHRGQRVGRYVVLGELGAGAMGAVYRAYDPELQREVALKRLRPDTEDDHAAARLIREARAMARLNHPNVVAVYDVVVDGDIVTLAMECVEGGTLTEWLKKERDPASILATLIQAGRGLAAAHRAGFIHRDFKPANVLVSDDGTAKVTDFGLVRAGADAEPPSHARDAEDLSSGEPGLTRHSTIVGTPRYMAPEQVSSGTVDARADQYAFCVTVWQALTGSTPFDGDFAALQMRKLAGPGPLARSVRVSRRVARALQRGLSPRPADRWTDMDALLRELDPRSKGRARWVAGGVVATLVGAGAIVMREQEADPCQGVDAALDDAWSEQTQARLARAFAATKAPYADRAWQRVDRSLDAYVDAWKKQRLDACEAARVRHEQTIAQMDLRVGCLQGGRARVAAIVDVLSNADASVVAHAYDLVRDLPAVQRCSDLEALARGSSGPAPGVSTQLLDELETSSARARALVTAGQYTQAIDVASQAWERSTPLEPHPLRARIGRAYAEALAQQGHFDDSVEVFRVALRNAFAYDDDEQAALVALTFAHHLVNNGQRGAEALWLAEVGAGIAQRRAANDALRARAISILGQTHRALGNLDKALELDRRALQMRIETLGEDHPDVAVSRNNLGFLLYDLDRPVDAIEQLERALEIWRAHRGDGHPDVATARNNLAMVLEQAGRTSEAEAQYREALRIRSAVFGESHVSTIAVRHNLGLVMMSQDKDVEAERQIRMAIEQWEATLPSEHAYHAIARNSLGLVLKKLGRLEEALESFRAAVEMGEATYGPDHHQMCQLWNNLADTLMRQDDDIEALELTRKSLALCEKRLGPEHRTTQAAREHLDTLLDEHR